MPSGRGKNKNRKKTLGRNVDWKVSCTTPAQVTHKLSKNCLLSLLDIYILLTTSGTGKFWLMFYPGTWKGETSESEKFGLNKF